jgi:hypothetical protein
MILHGSQFDMLVTQRKEASWNNMMTGTLA